MFFKQSQLCFQIQSIHLFIRFDNLIISTHHLNSSSQFVISTHHLNSSSQLIISTHLEGHFYFNSLEWGKYQTLRIKNQRKKSFLFCFVALRIIFAFIFLFNILNLVSPQSLSVFVESCPYNTKPKVLLQILLNLDLLPQSSS